MLISYFVHDVGDPAVRRRVRMFQAGGARVKLTGFHRKEPVNDLEGVAPVNLGRTVDGRLLARAGATLRASLQTERMQHQVAGADAIVARNLEMLAIAVRMRGSRRDIPLVYESLDIHRALLGRGVAGHALRWLEGRLARNASALLTSSPSFVSHYFEPLSSVRLPVILAENKVFLGSDDLRVPRRDARVPGPWRVGWFGAIRCLKSFHLLSHLTRAAGGTIEVHIRGRPTASVFPDFAAMVAAEPFMHFHGPYRNPEDLAGIYAAVDFAWGIDFYEEGQNSRWLLPNRLYESGWAGSVPIALADTATGAWLAARNVGVTLAAATHDALAAFFASLDHVQLDHLVQQVLRVEPTAWLCSPAECRALVAAIRG